MHLDIVFSIFVIFSGAAVLATAALVTRQSLLVAYILLGVLFGPSSLGFVGNTTIVEQIGEVGIIFLLFLLGLHLQPQNLLHMLRKTTLVAVASSLIFFASGYLIAYYFGFARADCLIIAASMMLSSTIIGLKLLPTTILHHQHTGEVMISVLLMQDLIAVVVLLILHGAGSPAGFGVTDFLKIVVAFPLLSVLAFAVERLVLVKLLAKFDQIQEYIFLLSIGWCLAMAELASYVGLSQEIGAFIAGVVLASSPIALYIADSLRPVRDFFLVMFFFTIGARFDLSFVPSIWIPALLLTLVALVVKPLVFRFLLRHVSETRRVAWEVGVRLGQGSEFSLLMVTIALSTQLIGHEAANVIKAVTILSFIASSYIVVLRYPTPIALTERMRRD